MGEEELRQLIKGCVKQDRKSQKMLYKAFYGFSMNICLRYTGNNNEASEVLNQGFFKVFTHIKSFDMERPFKAWLGRIMANAAIDHYRANLKMSDTEELDHAGHISDSELADKNLNYHDLLALVQQLPLAYRTVFNLFAVDGYSHEEIGELLNISTGTSKSNLHKARQKLKQMILKGDEVTPNTNYNDNLADKSVVTISGGDTGNVFFNNDIRE